MAIEFSAEEQDAAQRAINVALQASHANSYVGLPNLTIRLQATLTRLEGLAREHVAFACLCVQPCRHERLRQFLDELEAQR